MQTTAELSYDTAMVIDPGRRERQEDALASDFPTGGGLGFVVLADGMGGHAAGDVASKIAVTEVFSELKMRSGEPEAFEDKIGHVLRGAATHANTCIGLYARDNPSASGMGATLLAAVLRENRLYWVSVGDSPFYLFRNGALRRLNEDHTLGSQIEYLVSSGIMSRAEALDHPDQTCLTSVLIGREIAQMDCRSTPVTVLEGDILIAASDGIQFISDEQIEGLLRFQHGNSAEAISAALADQIKQLDDPCQDNLSLCVIKAVSEAAASAPADTTDSYARTKDGKIETITILTRVKRARNAMGQG